MQLVSARPRIGAVLVLAALLHPATADAKKIWSYAPEKGFVDDAMALDGARFAYVHTDTATFLDIRVVDLGSLKQIFELKIPEPRRVPHLLAFTADGARLLFVWMDPRSGKRTATLYDVASGKRLKEVGKADHAALARVAGEQVLALASTSKDKRGAERHVIEAYRTADLRKAKAARVSVAADRTIDKPKLQVLYWGRGQLSLVGMARGAYDAKRDVRLPERALAFDLLARKELWSEEPKDLVVWHRATSLRARHPGQTRFLQVSDDLQRLQLIDERNGMHAVGLPVSWGLYEPKSLRQHESWDGDKLHFSMTIDPVNAAAVARRKADKERMDLYRLDPGPKAVPLAQVLTEGRRFTWVVGETRFAYLRKLKGFDRGGNAVELHTFK